MKEITQAEMKIVLTLIKSPEVMYNANSLSKVIGITPMGTLKILRRLASEHTLLPKKIGNAIIYTANISDPYVRKYFSLILLREAQYADPQVKRWIHEAQKIKNADVIILFGSILEKQNPNDIDLLLITDQKRFKKLQQEICAVNQINVKKIHPMYQTVKDIIKNIKRRDKPILNAIKGVFVAGEEGFLEIYDESRKE